MHSLAQLAQEQSSLVPKVVLEMACVVGDSTTLRIVQAAPGCKVYIPLLPEAGGKPHSAEQHAFAHLMDGKHWAKFCRVFGGQYMSIPKCQGLMNARRNASIIAEYDKQISINDLCMRYGLSHRQVQTVLNTGVVTTDFAIKQIDMFA